MNTRNALPVGRMAMVLVIALIFVGVGYSLWSDQLTISGTVKTGNVDVQFVDVGIEECVEVNGVKKCGAEVPAGKLAQCTFQVVDDTLQIGVEGIYPSYHCIVKFKVQSFGNVPVHLWLPKPTSAIPSWVKTNFEDCYDSGKQLHRNDTTAECSIDIHFNNTDGINQDAEYTFGWTILATQWNEDPVVTVKSSTMNFGPTGWGGWSCPADHPYVVSGTTDCELPLGQSLAWKPGATVNSFTYPTTPFGYTYSAGEQGWIVQNGGTGQSCHILVTCSTEPQ